MKLVGLRFTSGHAVWVAVLAPLAIMWARETRYWWAGPAVVAVAVVVATVTIRGRRLTGWLATAWRWLWRRRKPLEIPSEPVVGATVRPGDHLAVRWEGGALVTVIELVPRPFTPTVIVDGHAHTDDVVDTRLVERLLSVNCPDLEADIISAGYRVATTANADLVSHYREMIGSDPAPAHRRTWIILRAKPHRAGKSAQRRDRDVAGLASYLVASATRVADQLASNGVDARCERSFDDFDRATHVSFRKERWSRIEGNNTFTAAYAAPGGPDVWWSASADHTITRMRIVPGMPPRSTVLLTTPTKAKRPSGFSRIAGDQRFALHGQTLIPDRHWQVPIGSAGVLLGETASKYPVYVPFDDIDVSVSLGDAQAFLQFTLRAVAAGGIVTLTPHFRELAELIGVGTGLEAKVAWTNVTTYFSHRAGTDHVKLRRDVIGTPRHRRLPIRAISPPWESRYHQALPDQGRS
ncbi:type VII secretion protein EccE [Mycobacterium sp. 050134]|uniref:type VII secretion protein EccE n=1 Tax=Mycobacterium sp. 050134 TaxID=3096111 RepID=UPI002ED85BEA